MNPQPTNTETHKSFFQSLLFILFNLPHIRRLYESHPELWASNEIRAAVFSVWASQDKLLLEYHKSRSSSSSSASHTPDKKGKSKATSKPPPTPSLKPITLPNKFTRTFNNVFK
ncbi:hypothetical protein HK102_010186, partial [Quaeritorhiza haematococci]